MKANTPGRLELSNRRSQITLVAFMVAGVISLMAATPKPAATDFFALYPIVPDDALNRTFAKGFGYQTDFLVNTGVKVVNGLYRPDAVLTFDHIAKVGITAREIGAAPIDGIKLVISDAGAKKLGEYLGQPNAKEMVVFIDGYAYATVTLDLAREMVEKRVLWVIPPDPQADITHRFLDLLLDKLQRRMDEQHPGKN